MLRMAIGTLILWSVLSACESQPPASEATGAVSDTQAMQQATAAANEIIRNASDCDAVQANARDVFAKLDEISGNLQTQVGRTSMDSLRRQVEQVASACGAR